MVDHLFSRRGFLARTGMLVAAGGVCLGEEGQGVAGERPGDEEDAKVSFTLYPVGRVEKKDASVQIRIFDRFKDALLGLDAWSHVNVVYWFDKNDVTQKRRILQVHPRGDKKNPLTGVFACRAPVRPNLIALSVCKIVSVRENVVVVDEIDAFDQTPVLDLKPFIPSDGPSTGVRVPPWARRGSDE